MRLKRWLIPHPFLVAIYPAMFVFVTNLGAYPMDIRDVLLPLLVSVLGMVVVYTLFALVFRHPERASLLASLFGILFFSFGRMDFMHSFVGAEWTAVYISALFILVMVVSFLYSRHLGRISRWMTIVTIILVASQPLLGLTKASTAKVRMGAVTEGEMKVTTTDRPDIYVIVLDAYGGQNMLRDLYGFDNSPFIDGLRQRGFDVVDESRSNYNMTVFSMSIMYNMNLIEEVGRLRGQPIEDTGTLTYALKNNPVWSFLKSIGYTTVAYQVGFPLVDFKNADVYLEPNGGFNEFQNLMISTTPIPYILRALDVTTFNDIIRRQTNYIFDHLPELAKKSTPTLTYAHVVSPHPPFVFQADGSPTTDPLLQRPRDGDRWALNEAERQLYRTAYVPQVEYLNKRVLGVVDEILATSEKPPVIVVMSDHGPGSEWRGYDIAASNLVERTSNLLSIYVPYGIEPKPYRGMTPINVFPIIFNRVFGTTLPLREDRTFFGALDDPHHPVEVTDQVRAK